MNHPCIGVGLRARRWLSGAILLPAVCLSSSCRASAPVQEPCVFPGNTRSVLTSDVPFAGDSTLSGYVVDAEMNPLRGALVLLEPGQHGAEVDSLGRFEFGDMPRGTYLLRAMHIGFEEASDSVTYSEVGVRVVAVLVRGTLGDHILCIRPSSGRLPLAHPSAG